MPKQLAKANDPVIIVRKTTSRTRFVNYLLISRLVFIFYTDFHAPTPQENWDLGAHTITISFLEAVRYEPTG